MQSFTVEQYKLHLPGCRERLCTARATDWPRDALRYGILAEHVGADLGDFPAEVQESARLFTAIRPEADSAHGLLITGPVGTGKTRLLAAISKEHYSAGTAFYYAMTRTMLRRMRDTYQDNAEETESAFMDYLCNVQVLLLDDLAHEGRISEAVVGNLHEVLSIRHGNFRPTIITTNLSLEQIGRAYDPSIQSRLSSWEQVVLAGRDWRRERSL